MPIATLLLRDDATTSLTTIVEKSQQRKPPLPEYDLRLHSCQLDLVLISKPAQQIIKSTSSDEGFESDIDSLSIVSSDDSFTNNALGNVPKTETDSANGSACSDSDDTDSTSVKKSIDVATVTTKINESYDLVKCVCYADVKFPNLLLFIIKEDVLVFKFDNLEVLHKFYANFNTLKAVTNQKTYGKSINTNTKFNLLQRTDNNGITHIEISREPNSSIILPDNYEPTSIISINAPDFKRNIDSKQNRLKNPKENGLRKVWVSADDLLEEPKKPERRRKIKGKAPEPPVEQKDVLKGEFVRINVPKVDPEEKIPLPDQKLNRAFNMLGNIKPKLTTYQQFKYSEPKKIEGGTLTRNRVNLENWTNSVPRLLKSQRSRSETRNFTPMAYRYIDTTINNSPIYNRRYQPMILSPLPTANNQISNRLFGMSGKLKEFGGGIQRYDSLEVVNRSEGNNRWGSLSELSHKLNSGENNLKSVIKKDENTKRKNEKKVTFSAYATVQVV